jgi:hypothetical protein
MIQDIPVTTNGKVVKAKLPVPLSDFSDIQLIEAKSDLINLMPRNNLLTWCGMILTVTIWEFSSSGARNY